MADTQTPVPPLSVAPASPAPSVANEQFPLLNVKGNVQIDKEAAEKKAEEALRNQPTPMSTLASDMEDGFRKAERERQTQTDLMMDALRRRAGVHDPTTMSEINRQGGWKKFLKITDEKCIDAEAWMSEVVIPDGGDRPWGLEPTPVSSLPPEVITPLVDQTTAQFEGMELEVTEEQVREAARQNKAAVVRSMQKEAKQRADNMETVIADEFAEGGFEDSCDDVISDIVTLGTGIMKGPFLQMNRDLAWIQAGWKPSVTERPIMRWQRVNPLLFFPTAGAVDCQHAVGLYEVDEFTRTALNSMVGCPGWSTDNILKIMEENPKGVTIPIATDSERALLQHRQTDELSGLNGMYRGLWYSGEMAGQKLLDWGLTGLVPEKVYEIIALKIGRYVVHARLNADPLGRRYYTKSVYKPIPGSFWGQGVPHIMAEVQDGANAVLRHMLNNIGQASSHRVVIEESDRLVEGEEITGDEPGKVYEFSGPSQTGKASMSFPQPELHSDAMLKVFDKFLAMADRRTGIPNYTAPNAASAVATTLSILLNQASRVLKKTIKAFDRYIIRPNVEMAFTWNMLFIDDESIKGDVKIVATGAMGLFVKEQQQLRLAEIMRLTANPAYLQVLGEKGIAALARKSVEGVGLPADDVVPTEDEIDQRQKAQQAAIQQQQQQAMLVGAGAGAPVPA